MHELEVDYDYPVKICKTITRRTALWADQTCEQLQLMGLREHGGEIETGDINIHSCRITCGNMIHASDASSC